VRCGNSDVDKRRGKHLRNNSRKTEEECHDDDNVGEYETTTETTVKTIHKAPAIHLILSFTDEV